MYECYILSLIINTYVTLLSYMKSISFSRAQIHLMLFDYMIFMKIDSYHIMMKTHTQATENTLMIP